MTREERFSEYLAEQYAAGGWKLSSPDEARQKLNFTPDLLLKRGNQHLVVEVKPAGHINSKALSTIRRLVESIDGWRFEVKLIPDDWGLKGSPAYSKDIKDRISLAQSLSEDGYSSEAFILLWTAVEALLQGPAIDKPLVSAEQIIREAYENDAISSASLRVLERGVQIRNQLVHGRSVSISEHEVKTLMSVVLELDRSAPVE